MVRLLKLLFFIYLVPPVLVGLNIRLVLHVILWFLENRSFGVICFFVFFNFLWDISIQPSCSMLRRH